MATRRKSRSTAAPVLSEKEQQLRAVTQRVVDRFTNSAMLFTALDVSNAVKQALPDVRHREISPIVREMFARRAMGDYKQTTIDVMAEGTTPAQAFLYHLPEHAPALYDDAMRSQLAIPPVSTSPGMDDDSGVTATTVEARVDVGQDGRGRLARQLLANAGIDTDVVLVDAQPSPPRVIVRASDGTMPAGAGSFAQLVPLEHPSLLQIPRAMFSVFESGSKLVARIVDGDTIEIAAA